MGEIMTKRKFRDRLRWIHEDSARVLREVDRIRSDIDVLVEVADKQMISESLKTISLSLHEVRRKIEEACNAINLNIATIQRSALEENEYLGG